MIGDIIQAVGAIAGGALGRGQHDSAGDQLRSTVNAARAMGISPLAALGGSTSWGPINPMGDAVQNAGAAIGRALSKDPNADLNAQLLKSQIAANNAQAADYLSSAQSRTMLAKLRALSTGGPRTVVAGPGGVSHIDMPGGGRFDVGKSSTAQVVENEYGDLPQSLYGLYRLAHDAVFQNAVPYIDRKIKQYGVDDRSMLDYYNRFSDYMWNW